MFVSVWFITVISTTNMIQFSVHLNPLIHGYQTIPVCGATIL